MKSILVTGGAGYIGSHTTVELIEQGFKPVILDDLSNSNASVIDQIEKITGEKVTFYQGDCADPFLVKDIFRKEKIEGVIHFAASKAVGESVEDPLKYYHNNVGSTMNILSVMDNTDVNKLVFSSSCTVYGQPETLPVNEESPFKPAESPYGNTKKICEDIISDYASANSSFHAISLRYFNPIGAHKSALIGELPIGKPNNLVPFIMQTAAGWRDELTIFGNDYDTPDGTCIRDYIHVVDLAVAHTKAFSFLGQMDDKNYEVFNLGTGKGNSVLEVINAFLDLGEGDLHYRIGARRPGDVEKVFADPTKAEKLLGWKTKYTMEESVLDAWNWQKSLQK